MTIDEFMAKHFVFDGLQADENRDVLEARMRADLEEMIRMAEDHAIFLYEEAAAKGQVLIRVRNPESFPPDASKHPSNE